MDENSTFKAFTQGKVFVPVHVTSASKMRFGFLLLFSAFAGLSLGQRVLNVKARTAQEIEAIYQMANRLNLDVWHRPRTLGDSFHILLPSEKDTFFETWLDRSGISTTVMVENVRKLIDEEKQSMQRSRQISRFSGFDFESYNTYEDIQHYVTNLDSATSKANVETGSIGSTAEGRDIVFIKLSSKNGEAASSVFIDCGIHAREWISPAVCMHVINQLANVGENEEMLKKYNWYIVPVLNPDGYEFSHAVNGNRLWRKNRFKNIGTSCIGVDLNRNFGFHYDPTIGGSTNPCSEIYAGTEEFSEAESKAVEKFILERESANFEVYLTMHSYGQMWLYPWGYTPESPEDLDDLHNIAQVARGALYQKYKTRYSIGSTYDLYPAAGGSDDWAKGVAGIKYSYTVELRDKRTFILPADQIKPTCEETWDALIAMVDTLKP